MTDISTQAVKAFVEKLRPDALIDPFWAQAIDTLTALVAKRDVLKASNAKLCDILSLIASCEKRADGDVVDIAQQAIAEARKVLG